MTGPYIDINTSLLAYCKNAITRQGLSGFEVFDFDTHASIQALPDADLIGICDYSITNQGDDFMVTCMIMVCTKADDTYLKRLRPVIDGLFSELTPGRDNSNLKVVDPSGITRGFMKVMKDVMVTPVGASETRPIQGIAVSLSVGYAQLPI